MKEFKALPVVDMSRQLFEGRAYQTPKLVYQARGCHLHGPPRLDVDFLRRCQKLEQLVSNLTVQQPEVRSPTKVIYNQESNISLLQLRSSFDESIKRNGRGK